MPRVKHRRLRKEIVRVAREMNGLGINQGTSGNVSGRLRDGFLVTPSGVPYDELTGDRLVVMDLEGGYWGDGLPSSEWRLHRDVYRERREIGGIVHTHSVHATALSCLRRDIPAFHYMVAVAGGTDIRCSDYATFGTTALSETMLRALEGRRACLLANHGMVCLGATPTKALALAVEVECLARQYWIARQLGEPVIIDDAEMARILERFATYGSQASPAPGETGAVLPPVRRDRPEAQ